MAQYMMGFLGAGNMGGALAVAACKGVSPAQVILADPLRGGNLAAELGCAHADAKTVAAQAQYVFLGVKPQMMQALLDEIAPVLSARRDRFVLVSMAAGLAMEKLSTMLGGRFPMIRIMPNTAAAVGAGMILYDCNGLVTTEDTASFVEAMAQAGRFDRLSEHLIDAGSCVSGCGPAFVDLFMEALADGGVACGLPRDKALLYAEQMVLGAAKLALESGEHPARLKDMVCSPGGSTIQGVRVLEKGGMRSALIEAVAAAYEKTLDLGK